MNAPDGAAAPAQGLGPRDVMAAERTFLAWVRTSLALLATGTAASSLPLLPGRDLRGLVGLACVVAVAPVAVSAQLRLGRWRATAARCGLAPPHRSALLLTSLVLVVAATVAGAVGVRLATAPRPTACRRPAPCAGPRL